MSHLYRMKRTMLIFEISFHTAIKQHMKYSKLWCKQHGGKSWEQQQLFGPTVKSRGSKKHSSEGKHFILAHHLITVITANYHRKEGWKSTKTTWKYQSSSICLLKACALSKWFYSKHFGKNSLRNTNYCVYLHWFSTLFSKCLYNQILMDNGCHDQ